MAWLPIAQTVPQYSNNGEPATGFVLKFYAAGTSTPIQMATDTGGLTLLDDVVLDSQGYPQLSGSIFIPHLEEQYKIALYPSQAAADANSGAVWNPDDIYPSVTQDTASQVTVSSNDTTPGYLNGKLTAGSGVTLTEEDDGSDESLKIDTPDKYYTTLAAAVADAANISVNDVVILKERILGYGGCATWYAISDPSNTLAVASGQTNVVTLKTDVSLNLKIDSNFNAAQVGLVGGTDEGVKIQHVVDLADSNDVIAHFPYVANKYISSIPIEFYANQTIAGDSGYKTTFRFTGGSNACFRFVGSTEAEGLNSTFKNLTIESATTQTGTAIRARNFTGLTLDQVNLSNFEKNVHVDWGIGLTIKKSNIVLATRGLQIGGDITDTGDKAGLRTAATATVITAATKASPCSVESTGHGLITGDVATIAGVGGMTELNDAAYTVTKIDNNNVTLDGINSTAYTTYTSGGTITKRSSRFMDSIHIEDSAFSSNVIDISDSGSIDSLGGLVITGGDCFESSVSPVAGKVTNMRFAGRRGLSIGGMWFENPQASRTAIIISNYDYDSVLQDITSGQINANDFLSTGGASTIGIDVQRGIIDINANTFNHATGRAIALSDTTSPSAVGINTYNGTYTSSEPILQSSEIHQILDPSRNSQLQSLSIGGSGNEITKTLKASSTLTFTAPGAVPGNSDQTITVTGAAFGDFAHVASNAAVESNRVLTAFVSASDTVTVRFTQLSGAASIPVGSGGTFKVLVLKT